MTRAIAAMDVDSAHVALISMGDLENCVRELGDTRSSFVSATEQNRPFYFEELHPVLMDITARVNGVLTRINKVTYGQDFAWRKSPEEGKAEFNAFNDQVVRVADLIRRRLAQLGTVK